MTARAAKRDKYAEAVQRAIEQRRDYSVRAVTFLDAGIDSDVYGAELEGGAVVLKVTSDPNTIVVADSVRLEDPVGVAPILDIIEHGEDMIIVQKRAHRFKDFDAPGYPSIGGYGAPVVADALEDALAYIEGEQMIEFEEMADKRILDRMPKWDEMDELSQVFVEQLHAGAGFIARAGGWEPDEVVFDWAKKNVGILEVEDLPAAVVIDLGLVL